VRLRALLLNPFTRLAISAALTWLAACRSSTVNWSYQTSRYPIGAYSAIALR